MLITPYCHGATNVGWNTPLHTEGSIVIESRGRYRIYNKFQTLSKKDIFGDEKVELEILTNVNVHSFHYTIALRNRNGYSLNHLAYEWYGIHVQGPVLLTTHRPWFLNRASK